VEHSLLFVWVKRKDSGDSLCSSLVTHAKTMFERGNVQLKGGKKYISSVPLDTVHCYSYSLVVFIQMRWRGKKDMGTQEPSGST